MNKYIQEITDHIKRIITPEDARELTNMEGKDPRMAIIEISNRLEGMYQTLFYGIEGHAAQLSNAAARLSLYAAAFSFELGQAREISRLGRPGKAGATSAVGGGGKG